MWPYVMLIISPIVLQHITISKVTPIAILSKNKSLFSMKVFFGMLVIMLILRHESMGFDTPVYKYIFNYISQNSWEIGMARSSEVAWSILNKIIAFLGGDFRWLIVISSILSTFFLSKAYIKYSIDASLTIAIFINMSNFVLLFSGIRQAIAISLGFLAFEFVRNKRVIPYILVIIVACFFHLSSFMLLFMYPLYNIKYRKSSLIFIVPIMLVIFVFNQPIFKFLGLILNQFTDYDTGINKTGSITMLILVVIFAVFSYVIPDETKLDSDTKGMRNFLMFSVVIQMFAPLHNLAMRMNYYYIAFIPLLIPRIIACRAHHMEAIAILAKYVMLVFFLIYFFAVSTHDNVLGTFPYRFLWENAT